jgi:hypothetical protein
MRSYTAGMMTLAAMLLASSACSYGIGATAGPAGPRDTKRTVQLNVTNHSGGPMDVYAAGSGTQYRIGTVHPGLPGRFVVRSGMVTNGVVEFTARSAGGAVVRSGVMLLGPGDVVDFELAGNTVTSTARVRAWRESALGEGAR